MTESGQKSVTILVVDDEDIVVSLVHDALEDEGYDVFMAPDGPEALEIIRNNHIDLLITDIRMPDMDGIELANKTQEICPDCAVIFMTGYANLNSAKDAIKQGAIDYILKPFELNEIRQAVSKAMDKRDEALAKSSDAQLEHLSDFSNMLVTTGDRHSLVQVALDFAVMHCQAEQGAILWWNKDLGEPRMVVSNGSESYQRDLEVNLSSCLQSVQWESFVQPVLVASIEDHPFYQANPCPETKNVILPEWFSDDTEMLVVPIVRPQAPYGIMMISIGQNSRITSSSIQKFLAISAGQLAMSLENLDLLEETQGAYARLKELQDETIQLEKMATRGEMSAEIGHELNNFVGVVAGNLSLLEFQLNKKNYGELDKYVRTMQETIENIKKFTANLMELTPISSTKEVIQFDRLLGEVIDYLKPQRRFREVSIICDQVDSPVPFEADSVHIQQLLYNLFNNAADATASCSERRITVSLARQCNDGTFVFSISDTGVGIDPEYMSKAFQEKFTTKPSGHGFGLLVCRRIIESHSGRVNISSEPHAGTTIQIEFPMSHHEAAVPSTPA